MTFTERAKSRGFEYWERRYTLSSKRLDKKFLYFVAPSIIIAILIEVLVVLAFLLNRDPEHLPEQIIRLIYHVYGPHYTLIEYRLIFLILPIAVLAGVCFFLFLYSFMVASRNKAEYHARQLQLSETRDKLFNSEPVVVNVLGSEGNVTIEHTGTTGPPKNDFFDGLIKLSDDYLRAYYSQTKVQAQNSFMVSLAIGIFGVLVISVGIVMLFADKTNPAYVTTAAGVMTEFISAVFFAFYNSTVKSMSKYHNKLVLSQNISIALRVAEELPEEMKGSVRADLIKQLVQDINKHIVTEEK